MVFDTSPFNSISHWHVVGEYIRWEHGIVRGIVRKRSASLCSGFHVCGLYASLHPMCSQGYGMGTFQSLERRFWTWRSGRKVSRALGTDSIGWAPRLHFMIATSFVLLVEMREGSD